MPQGASLSLRRPCLDACGSSRLELSLLPPEQCHTPDRTWLRGDSQSRTADSAAGRMPRIHHKTSSLLEFPGATALTAHGASLPLCLCRGKAKHPALQSLGHFNPASLLVAEPSGNGQLAHTSAEFVARQREFSLPFRIAALSVLSVQIPRE